MNREPLNSTPGASPDVLASAASGTDGNVSAGRTKTKKVRSACERCRSRRIKCDGQVPACGNCFKAGTQCIDVDNLDAERRVVRGFTENAAARIVWLEDIIRTQLPHVNLDDGPQLIIQRDTFTGVRSDISSVPKWPPSASSSNLVSTGPETGGVVAQTPTSSIQQVDARGVKRPLSAVNRASSQDRETSVEQDTRSVALDLGLMSLNSESRQVHYLGTSSGSLFAPLFRSKESGSGAMGSSKTAGASREVDSGNGEHFGSSKHLDVSDAREVRKVVDNLYERLRKDLPTRHECNLLSNLFFQQMHPNHPFLHRPSFDGVVDALYECMVAPKDSPIQYNGWPTAVLPFTYNGEEHMSHGRKLIPVSAHVAAFQLFLVLSIGATLQIRRRKYNHNPATFFRAAVGISDHVFGIISLPVLQAILLLIIHSFIDPEGCDVWTLTHIAMAHAVDLGIHREVGSSGKFNQTAVDMRRRIFFCAYALDRSVSTIQGRPLGLGDDTFDVRLPELADPHAAAYEDLSPNSVADNATMPYSVHVFKMARCISKIKFRFYRLPNQTDGYSSRQDHPAARKQLCAELDRWLAESSSIVARLPVDQRLPLKTKLQIQYHGTMCLLHQPSQVIVHPDDEALHTCFSSAAQRLRLYETLYESGSICYTWRTVQDIFLAGATVMYCVSISDTVRRSVSMSTLARDFRTCSSMLSIGGEWWPIIRKARSSLERLANHVLELFAEKAQSDSLATQFVPPIEAHQITSSLTGSESGIEPNLFGIAGMEHTMASILNHDGQLVNIFDTTPMSAFMDGMPEHSQDAYALNDGFWSNFDENEFSQSTSQARADTRNLYDFMDNLGQ